MKRTLIATVAAIALAMAVAAPTSADVIVPPVPKIVPVGGGGSAFNGWPAVGIIAVAGVLCLYDLGEKIAGHKPWAPPANSYYWKR